MKKILGIVIVVVLLSMVLSTNPVSAEYKGNCPTSGRDYEFYPPDYRIDGYTVTFSQPTIFCVKASNYNSGKITGLSYTVDWLNVGGQVPDISSVSVYGYPTAVTLQYFSVNYGRNTNVLTWETASEHDSLGFNIYRSKTEFSKKKIVVNKLMIPCENVGSPFGSIYTIVDKTGKSFTYWLESIDIYGNSSFYKAEIAP